MSNPLLVAASWALSLNEVTSECYIHTMAKFSLLLVTLGGHSEAKQGDTEKMIFGWYPTWTLGIEVSKTFF